MMEPVPSASSSGKMGASFRTVVKRFTMDTFRSMMMGMVVMIIKMTIAKYLLNRSRMMGMITIFASCALVLR